MHIEPKSIFPVNKERVQMELLSEQTILNADKSENKQTPDELQHSHSVLFCKTERQNHKLVVAVNFFNLVNQ